MHMHACMYVRMHIHIYIYLCGAGTCVCVYMRIRVCAWVKYIECYGETRAGKLHKMAQTLGASVRSMGVFRARVGFREQGHPMWGAMVL